MTPKWATYGLMMQIWNMKNKNGSNKMTKLNKQTFFLKEIVFRPYIVSCNTISRYFKKIFDENTIKYINNSICHKPYRCKSPCDFYLPRLIFFNLLKNNTSKNNIEFMLKKTRVLIKTYNKYYQKYYY